MSMSEFTIEEYRDALSSSAFSEDDFCSHLAPMSEDLVKNIERIVNACGGNPVGIMVTGPISWDMQRLAVATNPKYTDRCRNHPYFKDLLGQSYRGVRFE